MSTPDPQRPADPQPDGPQSGWAGTAGSTPGPSFEKPTEQTPAGRAGPAHEHATTPTYGHETAPPYDPLPGQAYDPRTGLPLAPPPGSWDAAYQTPYGTPPGSGYGYGSGPQQQAWYPQAGYGAYLPRPTNGMAIASLVLGILWIYWLGSILALIFGYVARQQIAQRGESGDGLAIAGIVLGWIGVGVLAVIVLFVFVGAAASVV